MQSGRKICNFLNLLIRFLNLLILMATLGICESYFNTMSVLSKQSQERASKNPSEGQK
jgi:hypothetical protein